jgi:hypothetical protein
MKTAALYASLVLFLIVLAGALRAVFELRLPFIRKLDDTIRQAFIVLAVAAAGLLAWPWHPSSDLGKGVHLNLRGEVSRWRTQ